MVLFNYATKELTAKVVYYGPGLCGKTTNLQYIFDSLPTHAKGKMLSLATKTDRTLFFDFLPIDLGTIRGMKTKIQLYTVPGQVFYDTTRKLVLKGADGVVFVADSQRAMSDANLDSFENLINNLKEQNLEIEDMPHVIQFNKRDMKNVMAVEEMDETLNRFQVPTFEAVAPKGEGVFETLKGISKLVLKNLSKKYGLEEDNRSKSSAVKSSRPAPSKPAPAEKPAVKAETPSPATAPPAQARPIAAAPLAEPQQPVKPPAQPIKPKAAPPKPAPPVEKTPVLAENERSMGDIDFVDDGIEIDEDPFGPDDFDNSVDDLDTSGLALESGPIGVSSGQGIFAESDGPGIDGTLEPLSALDDSEVVELDDMDDPLEVEELEDLAEIASMAGSDQSMSKAENDGEPINVPVSINLPSSLSGKPLQLMINITFED